MNLINGRVQASLAGLGNPLERVENPDLLPSTNSYNNKHINNVSGSVFTKLKLSSHYYFGECRDFKNGLEARKFDQSSAREMI